MFDEELPVANVALEDRENRKQEAGSRKQYGGPSEGQAGAILKRAVGWEIEGE